MKVVVRGYGDGKLIFEELVYAYVEHADLMEALVKKHILRVANFEKHMLEIEFIDEAPNPDRFVRFGTDPSLMVNPLQLKRDWVN